MHLCHAEECITSICICCTVCLSVFHPHFTHIPIHSPPPPHTISIPVEPLRNLGRAPPGLGLSPSATGARTTLRGANQGVSWDSLRVKRGYAYCQNRSSPLGRPVSNSVCVGGGGASIEPPKTVGGWTVCWLLFEIPPPPRARCVHRWATAKKIHGRITSILPARHASQALKDGAVYCIASRSPCSLGRAPRRTRAEHQHLCAVVIACNPYTVPLLPCSQRRRNAMQTMTMFRKGCTHTSIETGGRVRRPPTCILLDHKYPPPPCA